MSELARRVYKKLCEVPAGKVTTYAELARAAGIKNGQRAVGNIMNKNPNPVKVPCHRVVRSDGTVGGYAYGRGVKEDLLLGEGVRIDGGRIVDMEKTVHRF